jgi:uncharacterized membrane protein YsdA (DUF1294 family)
VTRRLVSLFVVCRQCQVLIYAPDACAAASRWYQIPKALIWFIEILRVEICQYLAGKYRDDFGVASHS